jgi:hypothetical protein
MSSAELAAWLKLGQGRMSGVESPKWREILASMHPTQRAFCADTRQGVIALAGRGAGKSYAMAARFHRPSAAHPNCSSVFVTISAERSREILLPAIWKLNDKFGLGIEERKGEGSIVWPNGYRVFLRGCKDRTEANKRRGTPWVAAAWDEVDSLNSALFEYDLHDCVEPRLMDYRGQWFAGGTPGAFPHGYWHKLSSGDDPRFPLHQWDARENPHLEARAYFIKTLQRMQGVPDRKMWPKGCRDLYDLIRDKECWKLLPPRFIREYLGQWVFDVASLIYRITPANTFGEFPIDPDYWTIGVDLGANNPEDPNLDHAAYTVAASHSSLPYIWVRESRRLHDITVNSLAAKLCALLEKYPQASVHIDSASAGKIIERSFQAMGIPIQNALKGPKLRRIQLMQSNIANRNLQLHITDTMDLRHEATALQWDELKRDHSPKCADDCWDSAQYACLPHIGDYRPEPEPPTEGSEEYERRKELEEYEQALAEAQEEWGEAA